MAGFAAKIFEKNCDALPGLIHTVHVMSVILELGSQANSTIKIVVSYEVVHSMRTAGGLDLNLVHWFCGYT